MEDEMMIKFSEHSHLLAEARREEMQMIVDFCKEELASFGEEKSSEYGLGAKDALRLIIREWDKTSGGDGQ